MWTLFLLFAALWQDPPAQLTAEVHDVRRAGACLHPLRRDVIDVRVSVQCRLNGRGAPSGCQVPQDTGLTSAQQEAAVCMAEIHRLRLPDGTLATDRDVTIPVRLRMNVTAPPPGFVPPGN